MNEITQPAGAARLEWPRREKKLSDLSLQPRNDILKPSVPQLMNNLSLLFLPLSSFVVAYHTLMHRWLSGLEVNGNQSAVVRSREVGVKKKQNVITTCLNDRRAVFGFLLFMNETPGNDFSFGAD
jgi:hypothetical protein